MVQPSDAPAPLNHPFSVIGPQFVAPQPLEVIVYKYPGWNLVITDIDHRIMLKVKPYDKIFRRQRVLLDADDNPIAMLRKKMHKPQTLKYAKDKFTVTIQANMDYACVIALFAIVDAMENPGAVKQVSAGAAGGVGDAIGAALIPS